MRSIFEFILGLFILLMFAAAFALAILGNDAPHASTLTNEHRAWVAKYATYTQDETAIEYLRGK